MNRVLLVLDPLFGDRLLKIPNGHPIWIVESPGNKSSISVFRKLHPADSHHTGLTSFENRNSSACDKFRDIFDTILEHHPVIAVLQVIGLAASPEIELFLNQAGFTISDSDEVSFIATQNAVEQDAAANP